MSKMEIDRLLLLIAKGDNVAFEKLYEGTKRGVFSFLYTYFHNYEDAEDAMQTVYLKIKRGITTYQPKTNGSAWILQIAKNHALNELKKSSKYLRADGFELENVVTDGGINQIEKSGITELMQKMLSEEEQQIIILHVLWGYRHREIALELACPVGTVTSKYKRAVEKLRKTLKEEGL